MLRKSLIAVLFLPMLIFAVPMMSSAQSGVSVSWADVDTATAVEADYVAAARAAAAKAGMSETDTATIVCDVDSKDMWTCKVSARCTGAGYCSYMKVRVTYVSGKYYAWALDGE